MSKVKLKAILKGVGSINNAIIFLEDVPIGNPVATPIGLRPTSISRKEWENKNILIDVIGKLEYQLNIHAFHGTAWEFDLFSMPGDKKILHLEGKTGDSENLGVGRNISIRRNSIKI